MTSLPLGGADWPQGVWLAATGPRTSTSALGWREVVVRPSYSFVLAVLLCVSTALFANSPTGHRVRARSQTAATGAAVQRPAAADFRLPSGSGSYSPHVKTRVNICVTCSFSPISVSLPSNALQASGLQGLSTWTGVADSSGSGSASGTTATVNAPALTGTARQFKTSYSNGGSERFYTTFGADTQATHFFYDAWVYIASPSSTVANLEMDMNQVLANGQTIIYGVQCDGYSNTWDYTANQGTPSSPSDVWIHSTASCNPRNWTSNAWHRVQMSYSRDNAGNVTYGSIWVDGVKQDINATVPSAFALGWGSVLLTNFQIDGLGSSGTTTVYLDNLSIYRW